jgi:serine/threonine protein kinase
MVGKTISHYKILEKLGEGGMGVVYKAQDLTLDRPVALKFLPQNLTAHEAEQARFLQEARAASALNHANICSIHAFGEHEGQLFIDMEFVDGKTLRERIQGSGLKVSEAVDYAIQIGEALQEAHAHGIVHRDVKTDNIMINAKNQAKVMDFGLAQLRDTLKLTKTTSTVGTLAYMAPEQIEGKPVDARSDIFSFGVVLYEMLTGHFPFRGEHEAAMMYSIVNEEADPIQKYIPQISSELVHIIGRSLEKDPGERYQTMSDVVIDLKRLKRTTTRVSLPTLESTAPARFSRKTYMIAGGAVIIILAAVIALFVLPKGSRTQNAKMFTRVLKVPNLSVNFPNISPDGNWITFVAEDARRIPNIFIVHASGGEPKQITQDTVYIGKQMPCFSPDASQIAYERIVPGETNVSDTYVVPALGGTSHKFINGATLAMWSPDGNQLAFFREHRKTQTLDLFVANADGTGEKRIATLNTPGFLNEAWSPDSKSIAFLKGFLSPNKERYTEVFVQSLEDSSERQLTFDKKIIDDFCWTPTDEIVFNSTRGGDVDLWVMPARGGTPAQLTLGAGADRVPRISRDGRRLVYVNESQTANLWRTDIPNGQITQLTFEDAQLFAPSYTPDGSRLTFYRNESFEMWLSGLVIANADGTEPSKVTLSMEGYTGYPPARWTPDGRSIVLTASRRDTVRRNPDSVVVRECILEHDALNSVTKRICDGALVDASRDGKYLLYKRSGDTVHWRTILALKSEPEKEIQEISDPWWGLTQFTWDSKNVLTQDSVGIWLHPLDQGNSRHLVKGTKKILLVRQMADGKSLLATEEDTKAKINNLIQFDPLSGKTRKICPLPNGAVVWGRNSSISPDGKSLVFTKGETKNRIVVLDNFR